MSLVGEVGDLGDLESGDLDWESEGDSGGATGEEGEGEKTDSSLGVLSILIMGGFTKSSAIWFFVLILTLLLFFFCTSGRKHEYNDI